MPQPIATELDGLRRALSSSSLGRIPPHVTLVPPRNVRPGDEQAVLAHLRACGGEAGPLRLELGPPGTFAPRTPVVFLGVGGEAAELAALGALRARLESGPLAPPAGRHEREFVPHVSLCGDAGEERAATLLEAVAGYRVPVVVDRLSLLERHDEAPRHPWQVVAEVVLGRPAVVGRGGVELELRVARRLDPGEQAWFEVEWHAYSEAMWGPGFEPDEALVLVARRAGRVVAVATGSLRPEVLHVRRLVVGRAERRQGIGAQVMRAVERLAVERRCPAVRIETADGGPAQRFYASLGFATIAVVPRHRGGRDFVVMERRLAAAG